MALVLIIDLVVVFALVGIALTKGVEEALPFAAFVIALLPLESRFQIPGLFDINAQRLAIITLAVLCFLLGKTNGNTKLTSTPMKYLLMVAYGWLLISTMNSIAFSDSLKSTLSQAVDLFLLYYIIVKAVSRVETVNSILHGIVAAMAICCIFGLIEAYRQWSIVFAFPSMVHRFGGEGGLLIDESRGLRIHSTYPAHELFGAALAMALPLALYLIAIAKTWIGKTFLWVVVMLMFWNNFKTGSRGPWLAMPLAVLPLLFCRQTRKYLLTITLLIVSVLVARPGVYETIKGQYIATVNPDSAMHGDYEGRYDLVRFAYKAINKNIGRMIWGYGSGSWDSMGFQDVWEDGSVHAVVSVDSDVAGFLEAYGYVGTFILFLMLIKPTVMALKYSQVAHQPENLLCLSLLGGMLAFLFMTTNVAIYDWGQQGFWMFILMGLAMTYPKWSRARPLLRKRLTPQLVWETDRIYSATSDRLTIVGTAQSPTL
jgi:hypothetical protein